MTTLINEAALKGRFLDFLPDSHFAPYFFLISYSPKLDG
jgi:hypothetical protein